LEHGGRTGKMAQKTGDAPMDLAALQASLPDLPRFLGMRLTHVEPERVVAEMVVRPEHCTTVDTIHGGALMLLADTMGAIGTTLNLRDGQSTATLESKTNFFAASPVGTTLVAETTPLHRGRRTHVWETRITHKDGRLAAKVTQTQMVL
jgi:1,4-dihydroxy-2-naphthoyl-CoA hydrolase